MDNEEFERRFCTRYPWWVYEILPGLIIGIVLLAGLLWVSSWLWG